MAGVRCAVRFSPRTPACWRYQYCSVVPFVARSCSGSDDSHQERQPQFPQQPSAKLLEWWDNRLVSSPSRPALQGSDEFEALCEQGRMDKALDTLRMDQRDIASLLKVYTSLLHICMKRKDLARAKLVYVHLTEHGMESSTFLAEYVMSTFVKCGGLEDALQVFQRLPYRSVFSWTCMISGYTISGQGRKALRMYTQMKEEGVKPQRYTFVSLLKACANLADLEEGKRIHAEVLKHGQEGDLIVQTSLVDMYGKCGSIMDAQDVFDGLVKYDVVSWNAMLAAYAHQGQGEMALQLYERMLEEGISPNVRTFVSVLQASGVLGEEENNASLNVQYINLQKAKVLHSDARRRCCDSNVFVANTLIGLYGRCGSIVDAQNVFDGLTQRNIVSWNAIMTAYALQGLAMNGLQLYERMQHEGVVPNDGTYITLISVYGKCGDSDSARSVFDGLPKHNVVVWNAMLAAYARLGQVQKALDLYIQMREELVSPDGWTFVTALQVCGVRSEKEADILVDGQRTKVEFLEKAKAIHADARSRAYDSHVFVARVLISTYGKCGSLLDARAVFDALPKRNVVAWNSMLAAYDEQSQAEKAFQVYEQMLEEGISPDGRTFVSVLQACGMLAEKEKGIPVYGQVVKINSLHWGLVIHEHARIKGYNTDAFVGSSLVTMYGRCGSILNAELVFNYLSSRSVVSWNGMLAAYVQQEQAEKAYKLYEQMREEGVTSDARTFVSILQACGMLAENEADWIVDVVSLKVKSLTLARTMHADAKRRGLDSDVFVGNTLISLYGKCGSIADAQELFDGLVHRDVVSWNVMLTAYVEQGLEGKALQLYAQMREDGEDLNAQTFLSSLQACSILSELEDDSVVDGQSTKIQSLNIVKTIHAEAWRMGYDSDEFVGNKLVNLYGKCGSIADAQAVFDSLSQHDVVAWTSMLAGCFQHGQAAKGFQLYKQMWDDGLYPDEIAWVSILQACSRTGTLATLKKVHHTVVSTGNNLSPLLASTLISAYGRCSSMVDAQGVFDALPHPDVVSWNSLIAGYAQQGNWARTVKCYEEMWLAGVKPNGVTFLSLIYACSHAGLVDKGVEYFESMTKEHGITQEIGHYVSMVDLLGRAGYFTRVDLLLSTMPMQPNVVFWLCLLSACQKHGNVVLGELAFYSAVHLQPKHAAAYLLMSNIYLDAGLVDRAIEVKVLRHKAGAWKKPGQCWVEHEQEIHMFLVQDVKHPQHQHVYNLLRKTDLVLKNEDYSFC